ncbi:MAG: SIMPL domain-containing protein [Anaerolineae bacterium]|nr:SIMPL domain-containing protein [Anaerolineae bacterium]
MKQFSISRDTVLIGFLIVIVLILVVPAARPQTSHLALAAQEPPAGCDPGRSVQVSGTAVVNVVPDRALIQLGVQSLDSSLDKVRAANDTSIRKVINALKALNIEDKDIATDRYVIMPVKDYDSVVIKGYRINNIVAVTLRDVSKTSDVIAAALNAGANEVVNVELYTSELRKYRDQARDLAVKAATEKAQALAGAAGAKTGCVLSINENTWSYYNGWWYGRDNSNVWTQNVVQNAAPSGGEGIPTSEDGPVNLGQISIRAEVSASFSLK